jgi:general secretion pathway protein D
LTLGGNQVIPAQPASAALAGALPFGVPSPVSGQIAGGPATVPYGGGPISSGLRSGTYATGINSLDTLLQTGSATGTASPAPGVLSVAGVFTDPQFQTVMRALSQKKGVDINASPSVTTKNGLKATVDITREFIYPTEFAPPQLPQNGNRTTIVVGATIQQIATPTTPTAFEMRKTGVYMEVEPIISDDGRTVELTISPELTDFEGFVNYGSPITAPSSSSFQPINLTGVGSGGTAFIPANQPEQLITPNLILQPIFKTQKVNTAVKIWDGATVVLGGAKVQQRTMVNDSIPLLGNLPLVGRFFQSNVERVDTKNVVIFVTVDVVDPSGQKINRDTASVTR